MKKSLTLIAAAVLTAAVTFAPQSQACTRLVYLGPDNTVLTGRSMDFSIDIPANLWIFPRGLERNGEVGANSIQWTSKYGSVAASWKSIIAATIKS